MTISQAEIKRQASNPEKAATTINIFLTNEIKKQNNSNRKKAFQEIQKLYKSKSRDTDLRELLLRLCLTTREKRKI